MRRLVALLVLIALALVPAAAQAKPRAKVYRGTFEAVGADGAYTDAKFGKAHLVDGKRNDQLSVHVRRLAPKTTYVFRLQAAPSGAPACESGAPGGTDVPGWRYRRDGRLRTNRKGVANSWARSKTFTAARTTAYFVGVYTVGASGAPDQLVLCAELKGRRGGSKGKNGDKDRDHGKGPKRDDDKGRDRGHGRNGSDDKGKDRGDDRKPDRAGRGGDHDDTGRGPRGGGTRP
jgi:hypothetical protein